MASEPNRNQDVKWLSETEQAAWRALFRMQAALANRLGRQLSAESELSVQDYPVLVFLNEAADGQLRPFELARELGVEKSRLSHHLARLAERGLVVREQCPTDRRGLLISITDRGRRALEAAAPGHVAAVREAFIDRLTPEQLATLVDIADAVLAGPACEEAPPECQEESDTDGS